MLTAIRVIDWFNGYDLVGRWVGCGSVRRRSFALALRVRRDEFLLTGMGSHNAQSRAKSSDPAPGQPRTDHTQTRGRQAIECCSRTTGRAGPSARTFFFYLMRCVFQPALISFASTDLVFVRFLCAPSKSGTENYLVCLVSTR